MRECKIMNELKFINQELNVIITNPIGSVNENNNYIYPLNYGYVKDNNIMIKTYILGLYEKKNIYKGKCIAIIKKINNDNELIVTYKNKYYTDEEIETLISFNEENSNYIIIRNLNTKSNPFVELASELVSLYKVNLDIAEKEIKNIIINNIKDTHVIEHTLDKLLEIPTEKSERLYNFLCEYLDTIQEEKAKSYKLLFKDTWN